MRLSGCLTALVLSLASLSPARADGFDRAALQNEAFEAAQQAMAGAAATALAQLGARFSAGTGDLAEAVRARQDLLEAWRKADRRLTQAMSSQNGFVNPAQLQAEVAGLQQQIAARDEEIRTRFPGYSDLALPRPISIAATQALLGPEEALVLILVGEKESFSFAVTRDEAHAIRVPASRASLIERVRSMRRTLDPAAPAVMRSALRGSLDDTVVENDNVRVDTAFRRADAHALYRDFLAPSDRLIAGKRRLFFVLDAPLDSLPMSLLVTEPPEGGDTDPAALRNTAWLIRRQAIVVLPSAGSLQTLRGPRPSARAPEPFRGYGAPVLGRGRPDMVVASRGAGTATSVYRDGQIDIEAVRALAPLPKTEGELVRIAAALGAGPQSVRTGEAATVTAVKSDDLTRFRVLAFATHGLLAGELRGLAEPALVFTPPHAAAGDDNGLLTSSDVARLRLAADWVVLSACNTASGDGTPGGGGLSGLARAFFYAGATSLLVSHWPVRDDAAARLTTTTFAELAADGSLGKADAFRRAVLQLLADGRDASLAHPAIWAPFVVVGEGR